MDEDAVRIFGILARNFVGATTIVPPRSTNSRTNLTVGVTFTSTEPGGDASLFMAFTPGTSSGGNRWLMESDGDFAEIL